MKELMGPSGLILLGAILSAVGALWAAKQETGFQHQIAQLTTRALYSVTGGDSYCYVRPFRSGPDGSERLLLIMGGKYPLYDVQARVVDLDLVDQLKGDPEAQVAALMGTTVT